MLTLNGLRLARILIRRRVRPSYFDNWYIHCPKCGSLLIRRLGPEGPKFECACERRRIIAVGIQ